MERLSREGLLARSPGIDEVRLRQAESLAERLKGAGFEGAKYGLATPLTKRNRESGRHSDPRRIQDHSEHHTRTRI